MIDNTEYYRRRAKSAIEARFLDNQLAAIMRDCTRFGFHEAAHMVACARQSLRDAFATHFRMQPDDPIFDPAAVEAAIN